MPRTHILYKTPVDKLDADIASLKSRRDALAAEGTIDIDIILSELRHVKQFNYQYGAIWFANTPGMRKTLPDFIGGQEEFVVPLEMGVLMELSQGNHISLFTKDHNPNKILPFLKNHGVQRATIDYSHAIHQRDDAIKELKEEQAAVDAIEAALKETYAT